METSRAILYYFRETNLGSWTPAYFQVTCYHRFCSYCLLPGCTPQGELPGGPSYRGLTGSGAHTSSQSPPLLGNSILASTDSSAEDASQERSFLRDTLYLVFITNFLFRLGKLALLSPFFSYQYRALMVLLPAIGTQIPCFRDSKNLFFSSLFFLLRDSKLYFETIAEY